jgi:hypothetical protein
MTSLPAKQILQFSKSMLGQNTQVTIKVGKKTRNTVSMLIRSLVIAVMVFV